MQALILAGGEGMRMRPITAHLPKPLLYLPGGTLLEHQLDLLADLTVSRIFVMVHHHAERMVSALKAAEGVTVLEQRPPFTLLGALGSAREHISEPFLVLHGDNYFSDKLGYLVDVAEGPASGLGPDALFLVDSGVDDREDAVRLAATGCYVLSLDVFPIINRLQGADTLRTLTAALLQSGMVVKELPLRGWRKNINDLEDLLEISRRILDNWTGSLHLPREAEGYNWVKDCPDAELPVWISRQSEIVDSDIGPHVVVSPEACVKECILREVIVFPGVEIIGRHVEQGVVIPTDAGCLVSASQDEIYRRKQSEGQQ